MFLKMTHLMVMTIMAEDRYIYLGKSEGIIDDFTIVHGTIKRSWVVKMLKYST